MYYDLIDWFGPHSNDINVSEQVKSMLIIPQTAPLTYLTKIIKPCKL